MPSLITLNSVIWDSPKYYLSKAAQKTMTATVQAWREHLPRFLPTPHPSWRTTGWVRKNPWFETEVVPALRRRVRELVR